MPSGCVRIPMSSCSISTYNQTAHFDGLEGSARFPCPGVGWVHRCDSFHRNHSVHSGRGGQGPRDPTRIFPRQRPPLRKFFIVFLR